MKINLTEQGQGDPLILIHGLGSNLQSWDTSANLLSKRFRVIRYDLRGHGLSDVPQGPWVLDEFVDDLEEVCRKTGVEQVRLAGFSLGGLITQGFCLRHSERVKQAVILSAIAGRTEEEQQRVAIRVQNLEQNKLDTNIELALERWFSPQFRQQHPDRVAGRLAALKATDPIGYLHAYRVFSLSDLGDQLHRITTPCLVMTGEGDPGSNVRMANFMHEEIANSQLDILPVLRHSVLVEAPELIASKLDQFFQVPS
ncbi:MAG: pimeloyl-ACP methyl ester carboxylesterase [Gammaproteobacteria bacterium]|jgi:pimeloyl-ACP methyl ester carboxylesterase